MDKARPSVTRGDPLFLKPRELDRSLALMLLAARDLETSADRILPPPLSGAHRLILMLLKQRRGTSAGDVQAALALSKQAVSRYVQQLAEAGLVESRPGAEDRRRRRLDLTDRGADLAEKVDRAQRRRLALAFKAGGAPTVEAFKEVLVRLMEPTTAEFLQATAPHD